MNYSSTNKKQSAENNIYFYDFHPQQENFKDEVISGMEKIPRTLAPKFFYDETGSKLFDEICETSEYYPTRTEIKILEDNIDEIKDCLGENCLIIEPGSGSCKKVRVLLDAVNPKAYMPLDISKDYLCIAAEEVAAEYPELEVHAACVDYTIPFPLPPFQENARKVAFFPGSSIGNFDPEHAISFLRNLATLLQPDGGLLIGVDLKKDANILNAAYNDKKGITAAFNQNLLARIANELDADIDINKFRHKAFYNEALGRVEMHLVSNENHTVSIDDNVFQFKKNESIHTENSYKYTIEEFQSLAKKAGFYPVKVWTDENALFSVHYFEIIK